LKNNIEALNVVNRQPGVRFIYQKEDADKLFYCIVYFYMQLGESEPGKVRSFTFNRRKK
jgi:hypothetical protein